MTANSSTNTCLQVVASGLLARSASSVPSIALSTVCHSAAERGLRPASASSHDISRSLIRVLAPARSPLSTSPAVSTTIARKGERSPSFDAAAKAVATKFGERSRFKEATPSSGKARVAIRTSFLMAGIFLLERVATLLKLCAAFECASARSQTSAIAFAFERSRLMLSRTTNPVMTTRNAMLVRMVPSPSPP
jgi:hypothetical protein